MKLTQLLIGLSLATPAAAQCRMHVLEDNGASVAVISAAAHLGWVATNGGGPEVLLWNPDLQSAAVIPAPPGAGNFNSSLALDAESLVVGDTTSEFAGVGSTSGAVWVFDRATEDLLHGLFPDDAASFDYFGWSVSIANGRLYVGAYGQDEHFTDAGAVYVFDLASGQQLAKWTAGALASAGDRFGWRVAAVEGLLLVSAPYRDASGTDAGAVFVLDGWTGQILYVIDAPTGQGVQRFGHALDLRGSTGVVGTHSSGDDRAYVIDAANGAVAYELGSPFEPFGGFGASVAIGANRIAVGAFATASAGPFTGSVVFYDTATGAYVDHVDGEATQHKLGTVLAADGHRVISTRGWVFATGGDCNGSGEWDGCDIAQGLSPDLDGNWVPDECEELGQSYCDGAPNSSGATARITLLGSDVVVENDLTLHVSRGPQNQFGFFLMSSVADHVPQFAGSQGTLCLGAPIIRLVLAQDAVFYTGTTGTAARALDLGQLPQNTSVLPGETWHFQAWFRDVVGIQLTSNTSGGRSVVFR